MLQLNHANLAPIAHAGTDAAWMGIQGLRIEPTCTVATDGHAMLIVELPTPPTDAPSDALPLAPCTIAKDSVALLRKALPKGARAEVDVPLSNANGTLLVNPGNLPLPLRKLELDFPNWRQVLPTGKPAYTATFDAALLGRVLTTIAGMPFKKKSARVTLAFFPDDGLCKITATTADEQAVTALVMPMRD